MSLAEPLAAVRDLSRAEKLQLIEVLAAELTEAEQPAPLASGRSYRVWSPYGAHEAAAVLLDVLRAETVRP